MYLVPYVEEKKIKTLNVEYVRSILARVFNFKYKTSQNNYNFHIITLFKTNSAPYERSIILGKMMVSLMTLGQNIV